MANLSPKGKKTKARILETARELFHKHGVRVTSVDQILESSGTGKSQFYHYFKNKDDLIHQVLESYLVQDQKGQGHINFNISSWEDLEKFFNDYVGALAMLNCERICPVFSIGAELSSESEPIRKDVDIYLEFVKDNISGFLAGLKKEGKLQKDADPDTIAYYCLASVHGSTLLGKIKKDPAVTKVSIDHAINYLRSFKK